MNKYQDSRNSYSMDNRNDYYGNYNNYDNYSRKNYNDCDSKDNYNHEKRSCCVRKVEETYCCFPSYYNEEKKEDKKDDKKEQNKCWEGTFKICPKNDCYDEKNDDTKDYIHNNRDSYGKCYDKNDYNGCEEKDQRDEHKCGCRQQHRCCFCNLFRNCRW